MTGILRAVRTGLLKMAPYHKRTNWGDMGGLTASVTEHGVIEPPVVRVVDEVYEVICGARRCRAALAAGLDTVTCMIVDVDDITAITMQVAENREREGLHPMDEAAYFEEFSRRGFSNGDIAKRFQVKPRDVERRLKLCALAPKLREAYAAGRFDDASALALARLDSVPKQVEILGAMDAGALQPEEIVGYCQREHTAQLEDVPWRVSDETMDGGACTACPKRNTVQRDLFDDVRGDRCLDVSCYKAKMEATWLREAEKPGTVQHEADTYTLFVPVAGGRPSVMKSSGMIDADGQCPHLSGYTWREAVNMAIRDSGGEAPTEYIAKDQDGRPRRLLRESLASRIVKRGDAAQSEAAARADADPAKAQAATGASSRAEARIRKAIVAQLAAKVAESDVDAWGWIVEQLIQLCSSRAVADTITQFEDPIKEISGETDSNGLIALVRKSNRRAKQIALAVLVRELADVGGELPPALVELAGDCDVDTDAIERSIRDQADK
jgi:ParB/RepB/Spo0J family partition protein